MTLIEMELFLIVCSLTRASSFLLQEGSGARQRANNQKQFHFNKRHLQSSAAEKLLCKQSRKHIILGWLYVRTPETHENLGLRSVYVNWTRYTYKYCDFFFGLRSTFFGDPHSSGRDRSFVCSSVWPQMASSKTMKILKVWRKCPRTNFENRLEWEVHLP